MVIDTSVLIASGCGILSTGAASFFTWLFSKRKYNSEVDNSNIKNMQASLDFYIKLADDYKDRLSNEIESHNKEVAELRAENAELKKEMREQERRFDEKLAAQQNEITLMKNQMLSVYGQVCLNFKCTERNASVLAEKTKSQHIKVDKKNKENVEKINNK